MGNPDNLKSVIEKAVSEVLTQVIPGLRDQIAQRVLEQVEREAALSPAATNVSALNHTLATVQAGTTQVQILDAMIEGASKFASRAALYVVRGANAVGWKAKGFNDDDAVRSSPLDIAEGLAVAALTSRTIVTGLSEEFMQGFGRKFQNPQQDCLVCPLVVRDKVVALIYADGGVNDHRLDRPALEALVRTTGLWLEVFATRKISSTPSVHPAAMAAAAAAVSAPIAVPPSAPVPSLEPSPMLGAVEAPPVAPSGERDEIHKKARRFAKLLVDEIKLYNQAKVSEGRQRRDLYERLRDDIEKSRASYDKRYGTTIAKDGDYFNQELVRILADNDPSLLGDNFPR
jgi:hypothetical protein